MRNFYRVCNVDSKSGLWYNPKGDFTGSIHKELNFCANSGLEMEFDQDIVGFLSVVGDMETLYSWFSKEDIKKLQLLGYYIHEYQSDEYKFYDRFQHWIIKQDSCKVVKRIII